MVCCCKTNQDPSLAKPGTVACSFAHNNSERCVRVLYCDMESRLLCFWALNSHSSLFAGWLYNNVHSSCIHPHLLLGCLHMFPLNTCSSHPFPCISPVTFQTAKCQLFFKWICYTWTTELYNPNPSLKFSLLQNSDHLEVPGISFTATAIYCSSCVSPNQSWWAISTDHQLARSSHKGWRHITGTGIASGSPHR